MKDKPTDESTTEFFVTRRGKQVGVHQLDMSGIDIDTPVKSTEPVRAKALSRPKVAMPRVGWSRRRTIIAASAVLVIILMPLALLEIMTAQYAGATNGAKNDLRSFVEKTVLPAQKKAITADQLRSFAGEVNRIATKMCKGGLIDNAAQLYSRAKEAHDDCKDSQRGYAGLVGALYALEADVRYLEKLDVVMKPVATPITEQYAVIGSQLNMWQEANDKLKTLSPSVRMRTAHIVLETNVASATEAWSKLNQANGAQNAADFRAAEQALNESYEGIRGTSGAFTKVIGESQAVVTKAYVDLTN